MGCDQVLPQIPFVLHHLEIKDEDEEENGFFVLHLLAHGAGNALGLDVDVDNVLLQVEAI